MKLKPSLTLRGWRVSFGSSLVWAPCLPLSGVDTGQAASLLSGLIFHIWKNGEDANPMELFLGEPNDISNNNGHHFWNGNHVQAPHSICRTESLCWLLGSTIPLLGLQKSKQKLGETKYLAHHLTVSNSRGWLANLCSWSLEGMLLAIILSRLNPSAWKIDVHTLLMLEVQVKEKHAQIFF